MNLKDYLSNPNVIAFLRVIRAGESSQEDSAYSVLFGGDHFEGFEKHPGILIRKGGYSSTAAGAYQFLQKTWAGLVKQYGFADFSPANQDLGAIALLIGRGALQDVINGDLKAALPKAGKEWASLPGSPYGQPTMTYAKAEAVFLKYGGTLQPAVVRRRLPNLPTDLPNLPTKEPAMPIAALIATFGPALLGMIPQLKKLLGGTEVADRNVDLATTVFQTAVKAAGAVNEQDAIDKMKADPEVLEAVKKAILTHPDVMELIEVGGGVAKAREVASSPNQIQFWRNPAWVVSMALLPLIYIVVVAVTFNIGATSWSDEMRSVVVTAIVTGLLGSITGFFLGSSLGSQKKTDALTEQAGK